MRLRAHCDAIVKFVFESPEQNRMIYSDYLEAFENSPLDVVFAGGFADVPFPPYVPDCDYADIFARLRAIYPDKKGFGHHGMVAMLSKPKVVIS